MAEELQPEHDEAPEPDGSAEISGILPIDKPTGMTSHDVVDEIRRLYGVKRVGHTGTLDPAASGLLLVMLGRATRVAPYLSGQDKTYLAAIEFGATSDTGDSEGTITPTGQAPPSAETLMRVIASFAGEVELEVPAMAAVRSGGTRRYELARRGVDVPKMVRMARIDSIDLVEYKQPIAQIRVRCSSGTYIRSLAQAIGEKCGCGAYLAALRREEIGQANVLAAYRLEYLDMLAFRGEPPVPPEPVDDYLGLPAITVKADAWASIHHGRHLTKRDFVKVDDDVIANGNIVLRMEQGEVIAIATSLHSAEGMRSESIPDEEQIITYRCVLI
jgi:tRNA pseudouridine55 synthase